MREFFWGSLRRAFGRLPLALALAAGCCCRASAQSAPADAERFLFIFDTSAAMRHRLGATRLEINNLLSSSMHGELRAGDSIGVWTFARRLRTGRFPLQTWMPDNAHQIAAAINDFLTGQSYSGATDFNCLQPLLDRVMRESPRLTVLIFCDGNGRVNWTPYNAGINAAFQDRRDAEAKAGQPFVLVIRTQLGRYDGCSVNFPPGMVNLPAFSTNSTGRGRAPQVFPRTAPAPAPAPAPPPPNEYRAPQKKFTSPRGG
ncbi:MAG: hypothetical protein KGR98_12035 [Verrucomicrobia bacterium]|nr:hypothetical protein [Verrucomicrobiota bacterium]MDE3098575.1 hypothetical protein [Verrucomicrobiota bacterium]